MFLFSVYKTSSIVKVQKELTRFLFKFLNGSTLSPFSICIRWVETEGQTGIGVHGPPGTSGASEYFSLRAEVRIGLVY